MLNRIKKELEYQQPREQAGFISKYSTLDHIFVLRQVMEKYTEYGKTLYIAFVDYSKAFDSIKHDELWKALREQGVQHKYIRILEEIYRKSKANVKLEKKGDTFEVRRGVRQGDPISPNLFNSLLEYIFRKLQWSKLGININGELLNHLRFADDIVLVTENHTDLQYMLQSLASHSRECGLEMNSEKTCIMTNDTKKIICINNNKIGYVDQYVYLGQNISFKSHYIEEVERRIKKAWSSYWSLKHIFKSHLNINLKKKAMDSVVTPTLLYGCQSWPITKEIVKKIQTFQRSTERSMLGLKLSDRHNCRDIREQTKITDAVKMICRLKWRWAGHTARTSDNRWSERVLHWYPRGERRPPGRPRRRWADDIVAVAGVTWTRLAKDRQNWNMMEEAYVQKWTSLNNS